MTKKNNNFIEGADYRTLNISKQYQLDLDKVFASDDINAKLNMFFEILDKGLFFKFDEWFVKDNEFLKQFVKEI